MIEITHYLKLMADKKAVDMFFSSGTPVHIKIESDLLPIGRTPLNPDVVQKLAYSLLTDAQIQTFEKELEMNLGVSRTGIGRFRVNIYRQRGSIAMVIRYIKSDIPKVTDLGLPQVLDRRVMEKRGLILVVGATGSGKSTTLAAMIEHRNRAAASHILTIEDPIEYIYQHNRSIVDQREVGLDTLSYGDALKNAMREAPDVILIGEIRDIETMQSAITYAETGHLCLSTLHANNANQTLDRIINFFPEQVRGQILGDLSVNLKAIISQRLVRRKDGGLVPAIELLIPSPHIRTLIQKGELTEIKRAMTDSGDPGVQTFDQSLFEYLSDGVVTQEEALKHADNPNDLALRIQFSGVGDSVQTDNLLMD